MTDLGLDAAQETKITVMQLKIERLEEKQEEFDRENPSYNEGGEHKFKTKFDCEININ